MKGRRAILTPLVVAVTALASGGWLLQRSAGENSLYANARLFETVLQRVERSFVDPEDTDTLYRMAIDGMLQELGDPHSSYLPAAEYEKLRVQTEGEYAGLGVQIIKRGNFITVIAPLPGTPGDRAGLRAAMPIAEVDGSIDPRLDRGRGSLPAARRARQQGGALGIAGRSGPADQVRGGSRRHSDQGGAGGIPGGTRRRVCGPGAVNATAATELRSEVTRLRQQGARRLILDLRRNPGGLLEEGSQVADLFLPKDALIVETRSRVAGQNQKLLAVNPDEFPNMPIVVLVGPGTASASKIVSRCLAGPRPCPGAG